MRRADNKGKRPVKGGAKKFGGFLAGFILLIAGITCVLGWWPYLVVVFKGAAGPVLALAGIVVLYVVSQ